MQNDSLTEKRFTELFERARVRHTAEFTDFLNLDEISTLKALLPEGSYTLFGGYEGAERCLALFGEEAPFPIQCIYIEPKGKKFAEKLTHRDFLGTLLGTGIERSVLGDIIINDSSAYVFCLESIAPYLTDSIDRVKHTSVNCSIIQTVPPFISQKPEVSTATVPSLRLDAVIATAYRISRSEATRLIQSEKVFINAKACRKESRTLLPGDTVSVRGYGKFIYENEARRTKKDRIVIELRIYK